LWKSEYIFLNNVRIPFWETFHLGFVDASAYLLSCERRIIEENKKGKKENFKAVSISPNGW